jgi:hypothetical protein
MFFENNFLYSGFLLAGLFGEENIDHQSSFFFGVRSVWLSRVFPTWELGGETGCPVAAKSYTVAVQLRLTIITDSPTMGVQLDV